MNYRSYSLSIAAIAVVTATFTGNAHAQMVNSPADAEGSGAWSVGCDAQNTVKQIDPIVNFGEAMSMHRHVFFGARDVTSGTTPEELADDPNPITTCNAMPDDPNLPTDLGEDNAAYWAPTLSHGTCYIDTDGKTQICPDEIKADLALNYYKQFPLPPGSTYANLVQKMPRGLEMMAGLPKNESGTGDASHAEFACIGFDKSYDPQIPHIPQNTLGTGFCPNWNGETTYLRMRVYFPNCIKNGWTGPGGTLPDQNWNQPDEMLYSDEQANGLCPTNFYAIPQVRIGVRWKLTGSDFPIKTTNCRGESPNGHEYFSCFDLSDAHLSSDHQLMDGMYTDDHGATAHADFMNGWTDDQLDSLMDICYYSATLGPHNCGAF